MTRNSRVIPIFCASSGILKMVMSLFMIGPSRPCAREKGGANGGPPGRRGWALDSFGADPPWRHWAFFGGRGLILFLTGFFGGGMTSAVPPRAVIFSAADLEKW